MVLTGGVLRMVWTSGGKGEYFRFSERDSHSLEASFVQIDLMRRRCIPVYCRGEDPLVLRGHWYLRNCRHDWLPFQEVIAEQLENAYREKILDFGLHLYEPQSLDVLRATPCRHTQIMD
uniref:Uncharacterized protein n=1 Tax=Physcomitrium patens TaxID=3218 RepID=A0A2K1KTY7_PHYPA|nr:hypothetical protein PHYPA_004213 [Physcomitrium patens]